VKIFAKFITEKLTTTLIHQHQPNLRGIERLLLITELPSMVIIVLVIFLTGSHKYKVHDMFTVK
jgi:hypothetical protein